MKKEKKRPKSQYFEIKVKIIPYNSELEIKSKILRWVRIKGGMKIWNEKSQFEIYVNICNKKSVTG